MPFSIFRDEYSHTAPLYDLIYVNGQVRSPSDIAFYLDWAQRLQGPVLEIGCGTGRVGFGIAASGIPYEGLDLSPTMLTEFQRKLDHADLHHVHLHRASMTDFDLGRQFSLIISPFRALAHLLTVEDQLACLACVRRHLAPGGMFVFDVFHPNYERLARHTIQRPHELDADVRDPASGARIRRYVSSLVNLRHQVLEFSPRIEVEQPDGSVTIHEERFLQRYYFRYEVEHLLARAGFDLQHLFGTFFEDPFDSVSGDMIFVASLHQQRPGDP